MNRRNKTEDKIKNRKKKRIGKKIFITILIVFAIAGAIFAKRVYDLNGNWIAAIMGHNKNTIKNLEKINILVMGESEGLSDSMMICSYDPANQKASILSIPRDTFTGDSTSSARAGDKLNSAFSNGNAPEKTLAAINKITGLNIKYYVLIDTKALVEIVDEIGGVEFDVPINMNYKDYSQDLIINLKAGMQKLTGDQVEQLVRFRHNSDGSTYPAEYGVEDYGRMRTQRALISTVAKQIAKVQNITKISKMTEILNKYVKTNIDLSNMKDYVPYAISMDMNNIRSEQLPGESKILNGIWFFLSDKEDTLKLVKELEI